MPPDGYPALQYLHSVRVSKRQARSIEDGLESAKPDLQSTFKKPGGDTAAA